MIKATKTAVKIFVAFISIPFAFVMLMERSDRRIPLTVNFNGGMGRFLHFQVCPNCGN
jgi:hypothetical protein